MASITKNAKGYRVQVYVKGLRDSASFPTRRGAEAWAARRETELRDAAVAAPGDRTTLGEVLARYRDEVTPTKRGKRWETLRIDQFISAGVLPVGAPVSSITPEDIAGWRNHRTRTVQAGTVLRELGLLASIMEHARREWKLIAANPVRDVRRPPSPDHREVVITRRQIIALLRVMDYSRQRRRPSQVRHAVAACFLVALFTGMRAGELCSLTWDRVFADHCSVTHKTGATERSLRHVPLPRRAREIIETMRGWDEQTVFGLTPASLDSMFRKYRRRAGLEGFTFHDTRHTAATRLAPKVDVLTLCKIFGWANPKQAMTYYNPTAPAIARRLNARRASGQPR